MIKYIIKRLLMMIPVVLGISFIIFFIMYMSPGSTARAILGIQANDEDIRMLEEELGLDKPVVVQYANYILNAVQGDFGVSFRTKEPVIDMIKVRFPITVRLTFLSITIAILIGIPIGILSAVKQYSLIDNLATFFALAGNSFPNFWFGMILIYIFSFVLDLVPSYGLDSWKSYILPAFAIGIQTSSQILRMTRSSMLEVIGQDYMRTAKGKGLKERTAIFTHALRNAFIPVLTVIGTTFGVLLGGTIVVETVFSIQGMGTLLIDAITKKDIPVVTGGIILIAVAFSLVNLTVDVLYGFIDPRMKTEG